MNRLPRVARGRGTGTYSARWTNLKVCCNSPTNLSKVACKTGGGVRGGGLC